ncbi:MAG: dihydroorotate dehydrogenase electron transfer subunit [Bacteroidales bacterium]|nr:dihydroorotate dehydrogenase electron transfer subunit [Bacteroidales bacterium]
MKKQTTNFVIEANEVCGERCHKLVLRHPGRLPEVMAGQFVEVLVPDCSGVMLRRPISIHDCDYERNLLVLLVQRVGKGTERVTDMKVGETLNLVYPLGNGFLHTFDQLPMRPLLVGGGIGAAPLLLVARRLLMSGSRPVILIGARTEGLIPARGSFESLGVDVRYSTEDGTLGERGLVTANSAMGNDYDAILTCGPTPMMKAVAHVAMERGIACEVSLENMMACGLGACLCCVTETTEGHKCVCQEGPVFTPQTLKWL